MTPYRGWEFSEVCGRPFAYRRRGTWGLDLVGLSNAEAMICARAEHYHDALRRKIDEREDAE